MAYRGKSRGNNRSPAGRKVISTANSGTRTVKAGGSSSGSGATSLNERFRLIHESKPAAAASSRQSFSLKSIRGGVAKKGGATNGARSQNKPKNNSANAGGKDGKPRNGKFRGRGRGAFRGKSKKPLSKDALDRDMEKYMMRDKDSGKAILDQDLDSYMMDVAQ